MGDGGWGGIQIGSRLEAPLARSDSAGRSVARCRLDGTLGLLPPVTVPGEEDALPTVTAGGLDIALGVVDEDHGCPVGCDAQLPFGGGIEGRVVLQDAEGPRVSDEITSRHARRKYAWSNRLASTPNCWLNATWPPPAPPGIEQDPVDVQGYDDTFGCPTRSHDIHSFTDSTGAG
jgi:hypothetical protein